RISCRALATSQRFRQARATSRRASDSLRTPDLAAIIDGGTAGPTRAGPTARPPDGQGPSPAHPRPAALPPVPGPARILVVGQRRLFLHLGAGATPQLYERGTAGHLRIACYIGESAFGDRELVRAQLWLAGQVGLGRGAPAGLEVDDDQATAVVAFEP